MANQGERVVTQFGEPIETVAEPEAETSSGSQIVSTGNREIDKKLGGGIPLGSLVLLEGQSDAGKSVVAQHLTYGALSSGMSMAYYTTENTVKSLMSQMNSLNLDVTDYFLSDRLRVYRRIFESVDSAPAPRPHRSRVAWYAGPSIRL